MADSFNIVGMTEFGEQLFVCNGNNTELYLHSEQYQEVDHLFHRIDERDRRIGGFIWRSILGEDEFDRIASFMHESGEYKIVYSPEPTEGDMEQFLHSQSEDLDSWDE